MGYIIRKAEEADLIKLNLLFQKLLEYERENYDKNIRNNLNINSYFDKMIKDSDNIILVVELENVIVGYLFGTIDKTNKIKKELEATINSIYIEDNYRKKGIGKALINHFINYVKKENIKYIYIENLEANNIARTLYNNLGFNIFKENRRLEIVDINESINN